MCEIQTTKVLVTKILFCSCVKRKGKSVFLICMKSTVSRLVLSHACPQLMPCKHLLTYAWMLKQTIMQCTSRVTSDIHTRKCTSEEEKGPINAQWQLLKQNNVVFLNLIWKIGQDNMRTIEIKTMVQTIRCNLLKMLKSFLNHPRYIAPLT